MTQNTTISPFRTKKLFSFVCLLLLTAILLACAKKDSGSSSGGSSGHTKRTYFGKWTKVTDGSVVEFYQQPNSNKIKVEINSTDSETHDLLPDTNLTDLTVVKLQTTHYLRNTQEDGSIKGNTKTINDTNKASPLSTSFDAPSTGGIDILLQAQKDKNIKKTTTTNATGSFSVTSLPTGKYDITASNKQTGEKAKTEITIVSKDTHAGVITLANTSLHNFKTQLIYKDDFLYSTQGEIPMTLRVKNIGSSRGTGLTVSFNLEGNTTKPINFSYPNSDSAGSRYIIGTIDPNGYKDIPIKLQFAPQLKNQNLSIKTTIKDSLGSGHVWTDTAGFILYKRSYKINFASAQSSLNGYISMSDGKQLRFDSGQKLTKTIKIPSFENKTIYIAMFGTDLQSETAYSIGFNASTDFALATFEDTDRYETTNKTKAKAVEILPYANITSYVHVGDVDFYKLNFKAMGIKEAKIQEELLQKALSSLTFSVSPQVFSTDNGYKKNTELIFTPSVFTNPLSSRLTYAWDFDGGTTTSDKKIPKHTYTTNGEYNAKLTITDPTDSKEYTADKVLGVGRYRNNASQVVYYDDLIWQDDNDAKTVSKPWQGAQSYCAGLSLANNTWRLPKKDELVAAYGIKSHFKNIQNYSHYASYYWSYTSNSDNNAYAWAVNFQDGAPDNGVTQSNSHHVRCIHAPD